MVLNTLYINGTNYMKIYSMGVSVVKENNIKKILGEFLSLYVQYDRKLKIYLMKVQLPKGTLLFHKTLVKYSK